MNLLDLTIMIFVSGLMTLIGAALLAFAFFAWRTGRISNATARASLAWPQTAGTIVSMSLVNELDELPLQVMGNPRNRRFRSFPFTAKVRYEFQVGGKSYSGTRVSFSDDNSESHSADATAKVAADYPVGKMV